MKTFRDHYEGGYQRRGNIPGPTLVQIQKRQKDYEKSSGRKYDWSRYDLPCEGCANSSSSAPFPGTPSGETSCFICLRSPHLESMQKTLQEWRDKSPESRRVKELSEFIGAPIDNYKTVDVLALHRERMREHEQKFAKLINAVKLAAANDPEKRLKSSD
jgi:hypothetical protein